ncbi:hypothetical protein JHK84_037013 [Glycine max]|nr:hypothetical protein JHK86_036786 [Glycine max]KAG5130616.1 hypothetical protein JHK84_037013 [Glycine max]
MGTRQGNKPSSKKSHAAEDSISADSLSFAGLVSIQDQNSKPPIPNHTTHYYKITPADVLISNGKIKPFQPNRPVLTDPPISLRSLLAIDHANNSKMSNVQQARKYDEQRVKARIHKSKERSSSVTRTWFGHKVFRSFLSPCRKCQATQPGAVKGQSVK